ncbi:hypothetical protein K461DRAFT_175114 [Myriangium duriaei CBS 260.36]|uniref:Uncharacterized protein n=1 Tax=Myriangium duriaei CBS 260.36 TaxID=1168546 RepID=A0A9P4IWW4_9PEZI|nr:hypothetical protein K461DRAFT_175114 [Myriangium duriaei CBS 260.36]
MGINTVQRVPSLVKGGFNKCKNLLYSKEKATMPSTGPSPSPIPFPGEIAPTNHMEDIEDMNRLIQVPEEDVESQRRISASVSICPTELDDSPYVGPSNRFDSSQQGANSSGCFLPRLHRKDGSSSPQTPISIKSVRRSRSPGYATHRYRRHSLFHHKNGQAKNEQAAQSRVQISRKSSILSSISSAIRAIIPGKRRDSGHGVPESPPQLPELDLSSPTNHDPTNDDEEVNEAPDCLWPLNADAQPPCCSHVQVGSDGERSSAPSVPRMHPLRYSRSRRNANEYGSRDRSWNTGREVGKLKQTAEADLWLAWEGMQRVREMRGEQDGEEGERGRRKTVG